MKIPNWLQFWLSSEVSFWGFSFSFFPHHIYNNKERVSFGATLRLSVCRLMVLGSNLETDSLLLEIRLRTSILLRPHIVGALCTKSPFFVYNNKAIAFPLTLGLGGSLLSHMPNSSLTRKRFPILF